MNVRFSVILLLASFFSFAVFAEPNDDFSPNKRKFPTPERTWTLVGGDSLLGRITKQNEGKKTVEVDEMTENGAKKRTLRVDEFSQQDQAFVKQYLTGVTGGKVIGVLDGDTIEILTPAKQRIRIRLYGVDAPERGQAYNKKAKAALSEMTFGQIVTVHIQKEDRYGRWIGTIYNAEGKHCSLELLKQGFVWHTEKYLPDNEAFATAHATAKAEKRGLWADPNAQAPWTFRSRGKKPKPFEQLVDEGRKIRVMEPKFTQLRKKVISSNASTAKLEKRPSLFTLLTAKMWKPKKPAPKFWLTQTSNKRHNEFCRHFGESPSGRPCKAHEGIPCKRCGG